LRGSGGKRGHEVAQFFDAIGAAIVQIPSATKRVAPMRTRGLAAEMFERGGSGAASSTGRETAHALHRFNANSKWQRLEFYCRFHPANAAFRNISSPRALFDGSP
jgi:hypothetical protein